MAGLGISDPGQQRRSGPVVRDPVPVGGQRATPVPQRARRAGAAAVHSLTSGPRRVLHPVRRPGRQPHVAGSPTRCRPAGRAHEEGRRERGPIRDREPLKHPSPRCGNRRRPGRVPAEPASGFGPGRGPGRVRAESQGSRRSGALRSLLLGVACHRSVGRRSRKRDRDRSHLREAPATKRPRPQPASSREPPLSPFRDARTRGARGDRRIASP